MKFLLLPLTSLAAVALLAGCNRSEGADAKKPADEYKPQPVERLASIPYKPGEEELLFPMKVGNSWTYEVEENIKPLKAAAPSVKRSTLILRCTNVVRVGDKVKGTIEAVFGGRVNERQVWMMDKTGLYQTSVGDPPVPYKPPMPAFKSPLTKGAKFEVNGRGFVADSTISDFKLNTTIDGEIEVDTSIGRVNSVAVNSTMKWAKGVSASTTWFAPKVGMVRWRQEVLTKDVVAVYLMRLTKLDLK